MNNEQSAKRQSIAAAVTFNELLSLFIEKAPDASLEASNWPRGLKSCLEVMLLAPTALCIVWGKNHRLFWNATCAKYAGFSNHLIYPGISCSDAFGSLWPFLKPVIESAQKGKTVQLNNIDVPDEWLHIPASCSFVLNPFKVDDTDMPAVLVSISPAPYPVNEQPLLPGITQGEPLFRQLVQQSPSAMCILKGKNFLVEIANPTYLMIVAKTESEFVGKPLFDSLPELREQGISSILESVLQSGKPFYGYEYAVYLSSRGTNGYFNFTYQPLREPETPEQVSGIIVVATDVTSQVVAKHRLQQNEKQFRNLALQSPIPMAILRGHDMVIELANRAMLEQIWHKDFAEVKHRKLLQVFPELSNQQMPVLLQKVYQTAKACRQNEVFHIVKSDAGSKECYFDLLFAPLLELSGKVEGVIITINDVTEKVTSRLLIEEAERRSRLAIEAADMGTFDWNLKNQQLKHSYRLAEILGFDPSENVTTERIIECYHPADRQIRYNAIKKAMQTGSLEFEARVVKPGNTIRWVKVYGKIVYNSNHQPLTMYGTVQDITVAKETMIALEESENRLTIAISNASLGTYDVDITTNIVLCSPRLYQILDIPPGTVVKRENIMQILYPDDIAKRNEAHKRSLQTGRVEYESRIVWRNGSIRWIKVNSRLVLNDQKQPVRILGTVLDITEHKNYINQLQESERRFRMVADTAPVMIWLAGPDMKSTFFNKAWLQFTGRTIEQELGDGWVEGVFEEDKERCFGIYRSCFEKHEEFYVEYRHKAADGNYRWISDNGVPRFDADGFFLGFIGGCMDIDARKRENELLSKSEARLRIAALSGELGTWDYDPQTEELYWDDACAGMFGVAYTSHSSANAFWSIVHTADDAQVTEKVRAALDPEIAANLDVEFRAWINAAKDTFKWINIKGKAFFKDGKPYRFAGTALDITEKKLALEALKESELLFKTIANTAPVVLWLSDENAKITFVNQTWALWTNRQFSQQGDEGWLDVVLSEDRHRVQELYISAFSKREKFSCEFRFINKENEVCYCLSEGFPYYNNDGSFAGFAGSIADVSQQLKNVEALRKSEERFRLLANAMPQFVWTADAKGNLNYFNENVFEYTGIPLKELEQSGWLQIVHPDDRLGNIEQWQQSITTGSNFFFEHRFKNKSGTYRWQLSRALPQKATDGTIQMWIGTSTDIHDQKLMAEYLEQMVIKRTTELQETNDELLRQKEFVEVIVDSSLIMVTAFDLNKNIIAFNNKCETVFGLKKEDIIGKPFKQAFPGIERSLTYENVNRALNGETVHISKYKSTVNGRYYESFFVPLKNQQEAVYAVLMTSHDITEIVVSAEKVQEAYHILEKQNNALERSNQELESFSYVASHDLQEPLRKIQTFIELLHRNFNNREESERYFEKIRMSAKRMAALIHDVLDYSRLSKKDEPSTDVDLNETINDVRTDFELLIAEKNATISAELLPVIKGNKLHFQQLFTNLISNSLKFSQQPPVIKISHTILPAAESAGITGLANAAYHRLTVADNGIGFEQQFADKIFTIFQRLNNRQYSGTGIGLALCKKIAENHNGTIIAESEPGKGATFHIYIPATTNN